jgi:lipopolysaccharide/colanic/teichoic acid biosynthesis glycosyltransferase/dTDP-glucose pyrophosphorylase
MNRKEKVLSGKEIISIDKVIERFKNSMNDPSTKCRVKKAVILAGGQETRLAPLTNYCPSWMFPILSRPLLEHTVECLRDNGIEEVIIALPEKSNITDYYKNEVSGISIKFHEKDRPRGTAGTLKDIEKFLDEDPFLVINSNLFVGYADLADFIEAHLETGSMVTVGVYKSNGRNGAEENFTIATDKTVKSFHTIHSSIDRRSPWRPSGIYLMNPSVLKFIDQKYYMDINEQLIPALQREALDVFAHEIKGFYSCINNMNDYIYVHRELLMNGHKPKLEPKVEIAKKVWVGKDVKISSNAYLLGPIVIDDGSEIKDGAQIIGPTVIGKGCQISEGAIVRECILWDGASLSNYSHAEYSIIGETSYIPDNSTIKNMIVLNGLRVGDANLIPSDYCIKGITALSDSITTGRSSHILYRIAKRIMDVVLSAAGIILLLPLFLLIAIAVKIDSPGSIFYLQKRCGKGGKLFNMLKFRTMIDNAENLQKELLSKNEVDGPLFKISNDPRVTRLGRILRETSLDEIPQLLNVLKGEMSLVGPRPLIMDEMKFSQSWRDTRLKVKPGITGLWQIQGRSMAPFHDWIRYDTFYVKNQSLWLDIKILFKTIKVVLKKAGAH